MIKVRNINIVRFFQIYLFISIINSGSLNAPISRYLLKNVSFVRFFDGNKLIFFKVAETRILFDRSYTVFLNVRL